MGSNYDIFISYKRKSLPTANNLYYRLTTRGYSTFFDLEEMGRDNFNVQLLNHIENAKDVFVILEEGSLDGCQKENWEEEDWFCHEIAFALEKKKNIIPILLGGYKMPSQDFFPDRLKELSLKNAPDFNFSFFEAYIDKLIEKDYILSKPNIQDKATSVFKFYSNENCQIFKEGKLVCSLEGMSDEPYYLPVQRKGDYRFKGVNSITAETKVIKEHIEADEEREIEIEWTVSKSSKPDQELSENVSKKKTYTMLKKIFRNGHDLFVNAIGDVVFESVWNEVGEFSEGLARIKDSHDRWGYINTNGEIVMACQWMYAYDFRGGFAAVENNRGLWGFIDKNRQEIIPCKWRVVGNFSEGFATVANFQGRWGLINTRGDICVPLTLKGIAPCSDGLCLIIDDDGKYGFINTEGTLVIPCKYIKAWSFTEHLAAVCDVSGKWGVINKEGDQIIPFEWESISPFSDGLARIQGHGQYGYMDTEGKIVIPFEWTKADSFSEGLALALDKNGEWVYINKLGEVAISGNWYGGTSFKNGYAWVNIGPTACLIDKSGNGLKEPI